MLKEIDLKLFEILDSEIDKTLQFWCYIKMLEYSKIFWLESDYWRYICVDQHFLYQDNPEWSLFYPDKWSDYIILWHYPTTNAILRYCHQKNILLNNHKDYNVLCIYNIDWYYFDTTKEIIDFTDEQKQELYDFLKTII